MLSPSPVAGGGDDDGPAILFAFLLAEDAPMTLAFRGALISCTSEVHYALTSKYQYFDSFSWAILVTYYGFIIFLGVEVQRIVDPGFETRGGAVYHNLCVLYIALSTR